MVLLQGHQITQLPESQELAPCCCTACYAARPHLRVTSNFVRAPPTLGRVPQANNKAQYANHIAAAAARVRATPHMCANRPTTYASNCCCTCAASGAPPPSPPPPPSMLNSCSPCSGCVCSACGLAVGCAGGVEGGGIEGTPGGESWAGCTCPSCTSAACSWTMVLPPPLLP